MSKDYFGTDGVRGLAGQYPLDEAGARSIGLAVGSFFGRAGQAMVIGCDTRESSGPLVDQVTAGLNAAGIQVIKAGVLPTPGLAFVTRENPAFVAGIMVTASHNPYQYNGIKVFDAQGDKLPDETEAALNQLIEHPPAAAGSGGSQTDPRLVQSYEEFLVGAADGLNLSGVTMAVDSANGAASGLSARIFERLGAEVTALFDKPDGHNINRRCGATDTAELQRTVVEKKNDFGLALDGDGDRLIMVDNLGREVKGDYILYILAVTARTKGVVATVMSNLGFEQALEKQGIQLTRTAVGDRYVLEGLKQTGYPLGGEQSGHIILPELLPTGDGLLAAVKTVLAVKESAKSLAAWCDEVPLLPQALVNIELADRSLLNRPAVAEFVQQQIRQLGSTGRLLIRPSGTEPLARIMVEAPDADTKAQAIAAQLSQLLNKEVR